MLGRILDMGRMLAVGRAVGRMLAAGEPAGLGTES